MYEAPTHSPPVTSPLLPIVVKPKFQAENRCNVRCDKQLLSMQTITAQAGGELWGTEGH
jgi:hypothetical protein